MQFYAPVIYDVKSKVSDRSRNEISLQQTEMVMGLETKKKKKEDIPGSEWSMHGYILTYSRL